MLLLQKSRASLSRTAQGFKRLLPEQGTPRAGLEPATPRLEGGCSIQLSYQDNCRPHLRPRVLMLRSRGERIRTSDPLRPRQVRYQAAPRPAGANA